MDDCLVKEYEGLTKRYRCSLKMDIQDRYAEGNNWLLSIGRAFKWISHALKDHGIPFNGKLVEQVN